ncbi:MAG: methyltransferase domain-containing protein [Acidobacteriota bacterium]
MSNLTRILPVIIVSCTGLIVSSSSDFALRAQRRTEAHEMHALHGNPREYIARLEDPKRDAYQKPAEVLSALGLQEGEVIADIGAGSGYFAFRFAPLVGHLGRIYAVDVSPDMILHLNRRIRDLGSGNVVTVLAEPNDPLLPDASIDRFFICNTWHHIRDQKQYLALMRRMLKPGGQIIMIDFHKKELPVGPPLEMKISRDELLSQMRAGGFHLASEHSFLPYQYFLVFTPSPSS